jgi:HAD superfamily hydrolase (TIGR01509 family)
MERCVIFDMDGVIIDSEPVHQECERQIFKILEINVSDEQHNALIGATDETMWFRIGDLYKLSMTVPKIIQLKKSLYMEYLRKEGCLKIITGIPELIADLDKNNFLLALASSSPHEQISYVLESLGIRHYFQSIISGEDVKVGKPDPEIFIKAAESVGVSPESCVVIEDSYNGVTAAKNANMKCIGYKNPNSGNQDLSDADITVSSLEKISVAMVKSILHSGRYFQVFSKDQLESFDHHKQ